MKKLNVLHLTTAFVVGGAEKVILDLCLHLDKEQFNPSVIGLASYDDMLPEYHDRGIRAEKLDMKKTPGEFMRVLRYLDSYIKENQIDILHAHLFHPLPFATFLKLRNPRLKVVFTSHNTDFGGRFARLFTRAFKGVRDADIVFSEEMITASYKKDAHVIANGVDIEKFRQSAEKNTPFTFLSVGTIRAQKNQIFLVDCARALKKKGLDFVINIAGGGEENRPLIEAIQQAIIANDVEDCVCMLGARSDIPELLKTAHCMVLPSHFEGLPIVLLEAGAARLPVISTPVGAIPTLIDESNGYLATLDQFVDTMQRVYEHYTEAEQKAQRLARKIDQYYSISSMARKHGTLYQSLVHGAA